MHVPYAYFPCKLHRAGKQKSIDIERIKRTSGGTTQSMSKDEMSEYMNKAAMLTGYPLPTDEDLLASGYLPH